MKDIFQERERGFEAEYFQRQDKKLIASIRERAHLQEIAIALAEKLAVDDPALLERVARLGLDRETGSAILLAPLVQVAWADGDVTDQEREAVLAIAASRGVVAGTAAHGQLLAWLRERPPVEVFDVAMDVVRIGLGVLPEPERAERTRGVLDACDRVAEASGGIAKLLGISRGVSGDEARQLEELARRLRGA